MDDRPAENEETLWILTLAPGIWAAYFLASYVTAALWCARVGGPDGVLGGVRLAIAAYTVVALAGIGATGWIGFRRHRLGAEKAPHDFDSPLSRHQFLGFAMLLLALLSAVATLYVALPVLFIQTCH